MPSTIITTQLQPQSLIRKLHGLLSKFINSRAPVMQQNDENKPCKKAFATAKAGRVLVDVWIGELSDLDPVEGMY
jgi:hypothetical protein